MPAKHSGHKSIKHDIIDKDNTNIIIAVSIAVFLVVFSLFAARALFSQGTYQQKVISEKKNALTELENSAEQAVELKKSYVAFASEPTNIIGGDSDGKGPKDGDNAKLVLDSLPYELDFPALTSSVEKILLEGDYEIQTIGGGDSELGAGSGNEEGASAPVSSDTVEIIFPLTVNASPQSALNLLQTLERSIRPFDITGLNIEGSGNALEVSINMKTFYKPSTSLQVSTKVVE